MTKLTARTRMLAGVGLGAMMFAAVAGQACAQSAVAVEEVVVTGTSIRGAAAIGATPTTFGKEEMQTRSPISVSDALSNVPQLNNFATEHENSTTNRFRTAGYIPVIHNMEIGSTLVLMNNHRTAAVGTEGVFSDPDTVPTIGLERVEVVADGNSAVYGADAVAGVVNFLYRRSFEGLEADASTGWDPNTSWATRRGSIIVGKTFENGLNAYIAYEHSERDSAATIELPAHGNSDHTDIGLRDGRGNVCQEASVVLNGQTRSGPGLLTNGLARCDVNLPGAGLGTTYRNSVLAAARYRLTDTIELTGDLNYSKYTGDTQASGYGTIDVTVPRTSPFFVVPPGVNPGTATSERVRRNIYDTFGTRPTKQSDFSFYGFSTAAIIDLSDTWQANVKLHHSFSYAHNGGQGGLDPLNLQTETLAGRFNPFGPAGNTPQVLATINDFYDTDNFGKQSLTEFEVKVDGPLFAIPGGEVKGAFGIDHKTETLRQIQTVGCDPKANTACTFFKLQRDDDTARGTNSGYFELSIPLYSDANALPFVQELTFSLAGRYDKPDGWDASFTPKAGFVYKPIDGVSIHGSAGKSYAAPNLGLMTATFALIQLGATTQGVTFDVYNMGGGSPDITPERAKTFSYGVDFRPPQVPGLSAGISYYNVAYTNIVYKPGRAEVIFNPAFKSARIVGDESRPTTPVIIAQSIIDQVAIQAPPNRPIEGLTFTLVHRSYPVNLGARNFAGVDMNARYDFDTPIGNITLSGNANRQLIRKTKVLPTDSFTNEIGTRTAPPWQATVGVAWRGANFPLRMSWDTSYMSGYNDILGGVCCDIEALVKHNANISYDFENIGKGVTAQLRINNVTDKAPPLYDSAALYDSSNTTPYGRQFIFTVKARF